MARQQRWIAKPKNIDIPEGFRIQKLPPGKAVGASDLKNWSGNGTPFDRKIKYLRIRCRRCSYLLEMPVQRRRNVQPVKCPKCQTPYRKKS